MLDGITVLNVIEVVDNDKLLLCICGAILMLVIAAGCISGWFYSDRVPVFAIGAIGFGILSGLLIVQATHMEAKHTNLYEVTISESVSMKEFNERYDIVDQRGQIYTIQEKNSAKRAIMRDLSLSLRFKKNMI